MKNRPLNHLRRHLESLLVEESYATARLVAGARAGNRSAFDQLMNVYDRPLRAFLCRRIEPNAVEDVLQETRIACWQGLPAFQGRARFKAWLFGIAHYKCANHYRARYATPTENYGDAEDSVTAPAARAVRDAYAAVDLRLCAESVLARLPEPQREVLELYYFADLTLEETATALGRKLSTTKAQFYRAHERALRMMEEEGQY